MITLAILSAVLMLICLIFGEGRPGDNVAFLAATLAVIMLCIRYLP